MNKSFDEFNKITEISIKKKQILKEILSRSYMDTE